MSSSVTESLTTFISDRSSSSANLRFMLSEPISTPSCSHDQDFHSCHGVRDKNCNINFILRLQIPLEEMLRTVRKAQSFGKLDKL